MKLTHLAAALLSLALAPAAYAQVDCYELRRVMTEAKDDFDNIRGKELEDDVYQSTLEIGGSRDCTIDLGLYPTYTCNFQFENTDWLWSAYRLRLGEVRGCLSNWKQTDLREQPYRDEGYRTLEGVSFEGSGQYEDMDWTVFIQQHMQNGRAHYHIWVELSYF